MIRQIVAGVAGLAAGVLVVSGIEAIGHAVYPPPPGLDFANPDAVRAAMQRMPPGALLFVVAAWLAGAFLGAWVATRLAHGIRIPGLVVGGLLLAATLANLFLIPHPVWMAVAGVAGVPLATWMGVLAARFPARR